MLQNPPVGALQDHIAALFKFLCAHHQHTDLSFDFLLQIRPQRLDFIHIHVADDQDVDQSAVLVFCREGVRLIVQRIFESCHVQQILGPVRKLFHFDE